MNVAGAGAAVFSLLRPCCCTSIKCWPRVMIQQLSIINYSNSRSTQAVVVVSQGVMMLPAASLPKDDPAAPNAPSVAVAAYKRLWVHEALRVFYDRLVDSNDRGWLLEQMRGIVSQHLGVQLDQLMAHLLQQDQTEVGQEQLRRWVGMQSNNTLAVLGQRFCSSCGCDASELCHCMSCSLVMWMNCILQAKSTAQWLESQRHVCCLQVLLW